MSASDDPRRVHFQSPEYLVDRLDAIADLFDTDRTDLLVDAIREYIEETAESETFRELVATKYYDDQLEFETVKQLVGAETAQRLRLLKADLEGSYSISQHPTISRSTMGRRKRLIRRPSPLVATSDERSTAAPDGGR